MRVSLYGIFRESLESPAPCNGRRKLGEISRINKPFKSPVVRSPAGSSPSTPINTPTRQNSYKRVRSAVAQSPLSLPNHQPKRTRLSVPSGEELREREAQLDLEIAQLESEGLSVEELDHQIDLLHRYNDVKDVAQIVMGRLAELDSVTVKSLHEKYGAPACKD